VTNACRFIKNTEMHKKLVCVSAYYVIHGIIHSKNCMFNIVGKSSIHKSNKNFYLLLLCKTGTQITDISFSILLD